MKTRITSFPLLLSAVSLVLVSCLVTSCTSLQQTTVAATDDLYYTPSAEASNNSTASSDKRRTNEQSLAENEQAYQEYQTYPDDRYLRLKVANRYRWDAIDDFGYWNDPRFNYAFYPSYLGWNSWYSGFYGSSWYNPFGVNIGFGWGGYYPYMNSYYSLGWGWGFNDFGYAGLGYGGWGYGGFGFGGLGYGGWNPYYAGYWNPYGYYYGGFGGGYIGAIPSRRIHFQDPRATQNSAPGLAAYRRQSSAGNFNNTINTLNGNTRYTGNTNLNNSFGNLLKRVVTNNTDANYANSWDRPSRSFNNNSQFKTTSTSVSPSNNSSYTPSMNTNSNTGGRSGGFNSAGSSTGGGRAPRSN